MRPDGFVVQYPSGTKERVSGRPGQSDLNGEWRHGGASGTSTWRLLKPEVERVIFWVKVNGRWQSDTFVPGEKIPRVELTWGHGWGPENTAPGNRPSFTVETLGKNLVGIQHPWIDPNTGLWLSDPYYKCAEGSQYRSHGDWYYCNNASGSYGDLEGIVGYGFKVKMGPGVTPGQKTLYMNDTYIPFELVIHGHPNPPKPSLKSVEIVAPDTLQPIEEVSVGQSFRVRLTYSETHVNSITEQVTIQTQDGEARTITLTGKSKVITSGPVKVSPIAKK